MAADEEMAARLRLAREALFDDASEAARRHGWKVSTYLAHENGQNGFKAAQAKEYARAFNVWPGWLYFNEGAGPRRTLPIMGYIGAGALIEPEYEQMPAGGLEEIDLPFSVPEDLIGFEVRGEFMLPRYEHGDVIVCWRDQQVSIDSMLNEELAVRTHDGHRYIKTVTRGLRGTHNLLSWNAKPINNVRIVWFSGIYLTLRAAQMRRMERRKLGKVGDRRAAPLRRGL